MDGHVKIKTFGGRTKIHVFYKVNWVLESLGTLRISSECQPKECSLASKDYPKGWPERSCLPDMGSGAGGDYRDLSFPPQTGPSYSLWLP